MVNLEFDDISFLVNQTLEFEKEQTSNPITAGLVYNLKKQGNSFVVYLLETQNISDTIESIVDFPENYPSLRLDLDEAVRAQLRFFEASEIKNLISIQKHFSAKRYSLHEEDYLNISDPMDSWWLEFGDYSMNLRFNLPHTKSDSSFVKLGPIWQYEDFQEKLKALYGYFKILLPVSEYSLSQANWKIRSTDIMLVEIGKIFAEGVISQKLEARFEQLLNDEKYTHLKEDIGLANDFLRELALRKSLWSSFEKDI